MLTMLALAILPAITDEVTKLHAIFDSNWENRLRESPTFATSVGRNEYDALLGSVTPHELAKRQKQRKATLDALAKIDRSKLPHGEQVNYDIFKEQIQQGIESYDFGDYEMPINADSGFHSGFARLSKEMPLATVKDYENYISRLNAWPRYVREQIDNMRLGLKSGITVPQASLAGYDLSIATHVIDDPTRSVFWPPFDKFPTTVAASEQERLRIAGRAAVLNAISGYREFLDFFRNEYYPGARKTLGASSLPNGRAYYQFKIREFTTLDLTPEQIHQIGLDEVDRINKEMDDVQKQVAFSGDRAAFLQFLRTDPRFYAKTGQELLERASFIAKRIDGKLPSEFKTLPRLPYTVEAVPDDIAPKYTSGRYVGAPWGSIQPGIYWVNTYKPEIRPLYQFAVMTLHEAVPGHHLQIALSRELQNEPNFRRFPYISAFGEGWGLYCEWLGKEMG